MLVIKVKLMNSFKRISVAVLISSLILFTFLAILSIWDVLADDIAWKSLSTLGVITFSSVIAVIVARIIENKDHSGNPPAPKV